MAAKVLGAEVTVGGESGISRPYAGVSGAVKELGKHVETNIEGLVVDEANNVVSSPAVMYEQGQVRRGFRLCGANGKRDLAEVQVDVLGRY